MAKKILRGVNERTVLFAVFIVLVVLALGSLFFVKPKMTGFVVGVGEFCNDTNVDDGDGCSASNLVEEGWECDDSVVPNVCVEIICSDGVLNSGEECDDGNIAEGDGCSDICVIETDWTCEGEPSVCESLEDTTPPVITLVGDAEITIKLGTEYNDEGATATDDVDEDLTSEIVVNGEVNSSLIGTYALTYDVNDSSGNAATQITRTVIVVDCDTEHMDLCDETECGDLDKYWYDGTCNADEECTDTCSSLGYECGEQIICGAEVNCGGCPLEQTCSSGTCVEEDEEDEETTSGETETTETSEESITGAITAPICTPNWECGAWTECVDGAQTRSCADTRKCGSNAGKPAVSQSCVVPETCSDGIKNQDEKGVDCGGVCEQRCSIFTIVGSAINVPLNSSKEFIQNHKAVSFSILGVVVLVVGWVICVKVFLKKKNLFFFLEKMKKPKFMKPNP